MCTFHLGVLKGEPARFPYAAFEAGLVAVHGLPADVRFKRPSSYGRAELETVLASKENIFITGKQSM